MRKLMLAGAVALMSACGGGGGFDKAKCTEAETAVKKTYNDCVAGSGDNITFSCNTYDANPSAYGKCDFTKYYDGWKDYVKCEGGMLKLGTTSPTLSCT